MLKIWPAAPLLAFAVTTSHAAMIVNLSQVGVGVAATVSGTLDLTPGTYVFSWASDNISLTIGGGAGAVPEPVNWAMMIGGFGLIGGAPLRPIRAAVDFT